MQCSTRPRATRQRSNSGTSADATNASISGHANDLGDIAHAINSVTGSFNDSAGNATADAKRGSLHTAARHHAERHDGARQRQSECAQRIDHTAVIGLSADNNRWHGQSNVRASDAAS